MAVQTLGEAWRLGRRLRVKCITTGDNWRAAHRNPAIACHSIHELE